MLSRSRKNARLVLAETDNELLKSPIKLGVTDFLSEKKRVENYPDFEILAHVIQQGVCIGNRMNASAFRDIYGHE